MTKNSGNGFYIVNLYFPSHLVNAVGLAVLSYRPSSFAEHIPDIYPTELQLNKANTSDKDSSFLG